MTSAREEVMRREASKQTKGYQFKINDENDAIIGRVAMRRWWWLWQREVKEQSADDRRLAKAEQDRALSCGLRGR